MDPYQVLGVSRDADEETIKKAYRDLVKKYHPDKYVNSPLADMASEKTKEINRAYDMINGKNMDTGPQNQGYNPFTGGYGNYGGYGQGGGNASPSYTNVRMLLTMGRTMDAERMLSSLPKNAEWYFLNGVICLRKGWHDQGVTSLKRAVEMDPNNIEYRNALDNITRRNTSYTTRTTTGGMGMDPCRACPCLCLPCIPIPCGCGPCCC